MSVCPLGKRSQSFGATTEWGPGTPVPSPNDHTIWPAGVTSITRLLNWSAMIVFAAVASGPASPLELPEELLAPELLPLPELLVPEPELELPELDDVVPSRPESSPAGLAPPEELELQP
jgi:hypothetical protein